MKWTSDEWVSMFVGDKSNEFVVRFRHMVHAPRTQTRASFALMQEIGEGNSQMVKLGRVFDRQVTLTD